LNATIPLYKEAGLDANLNLSHAYWLQGRLHLKQGHIDVAQQWAERCHNLLREATGDDEGKSVEWGQYERLIGRIAQARGDLTTARHHLERSAAIFRAGNSPIEVGRTAHFSGLLSLESGHTEKAREEWLTARQIFARLGAAADLKRVEEQLLLLEQT
jgi:hypothetical protein